MKKVPYEFNDSEPQSLRLMSQITMLCIYREADEEAAAFGQLTQGNHVGSFSSFVKTPVAYSNVNMGKIWRNQA